MTEQEKLAEEAVVADQAVAEEAAAEHPQLAYSEDGVSGGVARSGLWSFGGQLAVLLASLIATPFVVRLLAPELFGLLSLIQVLIAYLGFAGLGTQLASTRFGAEALARGDDEGEVAVVWTSLALAAVPATLAGVLFAIAAQPLMEILSIPPGLQGEGALALRIAVIGFVARSIHGCLNTPQAVRLRWDLITKIEAGTSIVQVGVIPVILAMGGGVVAAVAASTSVEAIRVLLHIVVSRRLQPRLLHVRVRRELVRPLIGFGGAVALSSLLIIPLVNVERLFVARFTSVTAVAQYSLAATVARMLSVFPVAICQPLLPAFTRMQSAGDSAGLKELFLRAIRVIFLFTIPAIILLWVVARPAFTLWAGPEYGRHSTGPFYILVLGLAGNAMAYPGANILFAANRADVMAKYYLVEIAPYTCFAALLTFRYGMLGAAMAHSIRMAGDWIFFSMAARRITPLPLSPIPENRAGFLIATVGLVTPNAIAEILAAPPLVRIALAIGSLLWYAAIVSTRVFTVDEIGWIKGVLRSLFSWMHRKVDDGPSSDRASVQSTSE